MPQLKSGRHVSIQVVNLADKVRFGSDVEVLALVVEYRLRVRSPKDLLGFMPVLYYRESEWSPSNAPTYPSGYSVRQVLDGESDWSMKEVEEFRQWLESNRALNECVAEEHQSVHEAIIASPLWESELMTDEPESGLQN